MVAFTRPQRLTLPLSTAVAAAAGALVAALFLLMPADRLENFVIASGLPAVVAAAAPPLGATARIALMLLVGGGTAIFAWLGAFLAFGTRTITIGRGMLGAAAAQRRADAHPDAPPREPVLANRDLGTPFLEVRSGKARAADPLLEPLPLHPAEQEIPLDLDQPLAAFDPLAITTEPLTPAEPLAPLTRPVPVQPVPVQQAMPLPVASPAPAPSTSTRPVAEPQPVQRARSLRYDPNTIRPLGSLLREDRPAPPPRAPISESATVHDLLVRLERGLSGGGHPAPPRSLDATLDDLRSMAIRR